MKFDYEWEINMDGLLGLWISLGVLAGLGLLALIVSAIQTFKEKFDVIVVGAGAAGMMSAIEAGKRGRKVLLVDHAKKIGEKIRISGGGRCNFTNIHTHPSKFISSNPKFVISALKQYTQNNFIDLIKKHVKKNKLIVFIAAANYQHFLDALNPLSVIVLKQGYEPRVMIFKEFINEFYG